MGRGRSSNGADGAGAVLFGIFMLVVLVPKEVWITLGVTAALVLVAWLIYRISRAVEEHRAEAQKRAEEERRRQAALAKREREERLRRERQERIDKLGKPYAELLEAAMAAVKQVAASEAARAGWLGDVDFSADIKGIADSFEKAHALGDVTVKLSALKNPSAEDRAILAEAEKTIAGLERTAIERVELIRNCAREAKLIDESLKTEREDARVAEQRAELHAKLTAMLYGIEAMPKTTHCDSAVDAVMARVAAYREIKKQIQQSR